MTEKERGGEGGGVSLSPMRDGGGGKRGSQMHERAEESEEGKTSDEMKRGDGAITEERCEKGKRTEREE